MILKAHKDMTSAALEDFFEAAIEEIRRLRKEEREREEELENLRRENVLLRMWATQANEPVEH